MKKEPRTEIVSVRLTKAEKELLQSKGGISKVLRQALEGPPFVGSVGWTITITGDSIVWQDGTVGPNWPAVATNF